LISLAIPFGSVSSMGIINHPQAAILQVESIVKKPVVIDDMNLKYDDQLKYIN
jgi:pyruvate/2-oxoglutarate dehydrogenase complex dihydrolipoamide acyltransferase (E2) component